MQEILCPQCGAAVRFESAGAVMVVCGSCRSTITKDADVARAVGRLSAVVEDGSPVRIGTRGNQAKRGFQVVGRLQMRYDAGFWNEWYVRFDDGSDGWLADASGQYALTRRQERSDTSTPVPPFEDVEVGHRLKVGGVAYLVSDRRRSRCIGGEGELPINAGDGWDACTVDLRRGRAFATIDYSDKGPVVYAGLSSERTDFDEKTLRDKEEIQASAGRYRGQVLPLDCPNCAGSVTIAAAMATQVVCPSCSSLLDCSGPRTEIIEANRRVARFHSTLSLGARGRLDAEYTVIGVMRRDVPRDSSEPAWTEYLLFNPERSYLWLVETSEGWQRVSVCDEWPTGVSDIMSTFRGTTWALKYEYEARVREVYGAFNWRVRRGDLVRVTDFVRHNQVLTREQSDNEMTWSHATPVSEATIARAFGLTVSARARPKSRAVAEAAERSEDLGSYAVIAIAASLLLMVMSATISSEALMVGLALVWGPIWIMHSVRDE